jgi:hypothetical protein
LELTVGLYIYAIWVDIILVQHLFRASFQFKRYMLLT